MACYNFLAANVLITNAAFNSASSGDYRICKYPAFTIVTNISIMRVAARFTSSGIVKSAKISIFKFWTLA
jgi:hypothetical protein